MSKKRLATGRWGEAVAADFLVERGYAVHTRNLRTPYGEIDLVAIKDNPTPHGRLVVFVEVKTRTSTAFGLPEQAVNHRKQIHMLEAAQYVLQQQPELGSEWRIDVIAVQSQPDGQPPIITHFENALQG